METRHIFVPSFNEVGGREMDGGRLNALKMIEALKLSCSGRIYPILPLKFDV